MNEQEFDPVKLEAIEEVAYATNNALETVIQLMIDKGYFTEKELMDKLDQLAEHDEDPEELQHDANAPRDQEDNSQQ